jgi:hypothetical protein
MGYAISIVAQLTFIAFATMKSKFRLTSDKHKNLHRILMVLHIISLTNYTICIFGAISSKNAWLKFPWIAAFLRPI